MFALQTVSRFIGPALVSSVLAVATACGDDGNTTPTTDTTVQNDTAVETDTATSDDTTAPADIAQPEGQRAATSSGARVAWVRGFDGPLSVGVTTTAEVTIQDAAGQPLTGLTPGVAFIHVGMGHGGNKSPFVDEIGNGVYEIGDLQASMAGTWELALSFGAGETISWSVEVQ